MKTPVIIAAYSEENNIAKTLESLPANKTEPIVAVNGSTDRTASIAREFGVHVIDIEEQGKLPAIQRALRELGGRALEPLIILDADTQPLFPQLWHNTMLNQLEPNADRPVAVGGPIVFTNGSLISCAVRSVRRTQRAIETRQSIEQGAGQCGPHMGLHIQNQTTLDEILTLPHYWPGEDYALARTIVDADGIFKQPLSPFLCARSPLSASSLSLHERQVLGAEETRKLVLENYSNRGAYGSFPYDGFA